MYPVLNLTHVLDFLDTSGMGVTVNMVDLDPMEDFQSEHIEPTEDLKEISIGPEAHKTTKIGTTLDPQEEAAIIALLKRNVDLFAWQPSDMPRIDLSIVCHHLSVNPNVKPVVQRKKRSGKKEERS
jgi:hypothetical protein